MVKLKGVLVIDGELHGIHTFNIFHTLCHFLINQRLKVGSGEKNDIGVQSMGSMGTSEVVQVNWLTEAVDVASMSLPQELGGGLRGLRILNNFGRT